MSISFSPPSGSTINFGSVTVGSSANQTVSVSFISPNSSNPGDYFYATDTSTITGPQASMFTGDMSDSFYGPGRDGDSHTFRFSPSAAGAATATLNWTYHQATGGDGLGFPGSGFYTLSGTGVAGPPPPPASPHEVVAMVGHNRILLIPSHGLTGNVLSYFDITSLNDVTDNSTIIFKAEDINLARVPTIRRVVITYIDLGPATIIVNVSGVNDQGALVQGQAVVSIGTPGASGNILTAFADLSVSCFRPQLKIIRNANGGQVYITSVMPLGTIEDQTL